MTSMHVDMGGLNPFEVYHIVYSNKKVEIIGEEAYKRMAASLQISCWVFEVKHAVGGRYLTYAYQAAFKWKFAFKLVAVVGARYRYAASNEIDKVCRKTVAPAGAPRLGRCRPPTHVVVLY